MLLNRISEWQRRARGIAIPVGSDILPARGGLLGPAFFPEGLGLQNPTETAEWPNIIAIGHNFGSEDYRNAIEPAGREDDKATFRNLRLLLENAGISIASCFMTNWFVGLQPGDKQVGEFLPRPDARYEQECRELLLHQIQTLKPRVILFLGLPVVSRAYQICPDLLPWKNAKNWIEVDSSSIGPVAYGLKISGTDIRCNAVALLHPSFAPSNQRYRRGLYANPKPEVEMLKYAHGLQKPLLLL